jgi:hypothetical protein
VLCPVRRAPRHVFCRACSPCRASVHWGTARAASVLHPRRAPETTAPGATVTTQAPCTTAKHQGQAPAPIARAAPVPLPIHRLSASPASPAPAAFALPSTPQNLFSSIYTLPLTHRRHGPAGVTRSLHLSSPAWSLLRLSHSCSCASHTPAPAPLTLLSPPWWRPPRAGHTRQQHLPCALGCQNLG